MTPAPTGSRPPARLFAWAAAAGLLLLPLLAMPFTDEVRWTAGDFMFAAVLLFGPLAAYEVVARATGSAAYRAGAGLALAGSVAVVWVGAAVGITDSDADGLYLLALAAGFAGAVVARFRPGGMALAMAAAALGVVGAGVTAVAAGAPAPTAPPLEVLGLSGGFAALFAGSAALFRAAARERVRARRA